MYRNYLKIAFRNLTKYKFYSLVNVMGLAFGIAAFLFILRYAQDEMSYDRYHPYADQTWRVDAYGKIGDQTILSAQNGAPVGPTMKRDFPEVVSYCRFRSRGSYLIKFENNHYKEENIVFVDSTVFNIFGINVVQGDSKSALSEPNSIVLTERMAEKYFGMEDPLGKALTLDSKDQYQVTGVIEKIPTNTHFNYDFLISMSSLEESRSTNWGSMNFNTYVVLQSDTDLESFQTKINDHLITNYFGPEVEKYIGMAWSEFIKGGNNFEYSLFPLHKIHLHSDMDDELAANSDMKYVWIFSIIGVFILFIACINFMNLSTARSAIRAKEIGVRKVVGAHRKNLIGQFLGESLLISFLALLFAWVVVFLTLSQFNALSGKIFDFNEMFRPGFLFFSLGLAIATGLLAGSYPAVFLSGFQPVKVLKGVFKIDNSGHNLRNGLVVFQFLITVFLICSTLVVYRQLSFIQNKKLGYDKEHLLVVNDAGALGKNVNAFKERLIGFEEVDNATVTGYLPVPSFSGTSSYFKGREPDMNNAILINNWFVDHDYVQTLEMEIVQGRDFSKKFSTDSSAVVINERLASYYEGDPIGQELSNFGDTGEELNVFKVIGVVKDFNFESLRQNIEPLALLIGGNSGSVTMRLQTNDIASFINNLQSIWTEMAPGQPFSYGFIDERFERMYEAETRIGQIIGVFAFLAIIIACIGLVGLSTFIAQQRTKEIGIRKVLGASSVGLVGLLSKDFVKLVCIALVVAIPISWWVMNSWLNGFAYRIDIGPDIFVMAGLIAILIASMTVGFQSIKAAIANPIESLRNE